jgi:transcriptional regulator with XRE-family HTH domain
MSTRASVSTPDGQFGPLLRSWRTSRRVTQLELALEAGVSARHVGFLECGRASPSRRMVLTLAEALAIPLRDQNMLLQAAGFAPVFLESDLSEPEMATVRTALELILRSHEPFGALATHPSVGRRDGQPAAGHHVDWARGAPRPSLSHSGSTAAQHAPIAVRPQRSAINRHELGRRCT